MNNCSVAEEISENPTSIFSDRSVEDDFTEYGNNLSFLHKNNFFKSHEYSIKSENTIKVFDNELISYDIECQSSIYCLIVKSLLTQNAILDDEEKNVQELIFRIKQCNSIPYNDSVARRLQILVQTVKDEDMSIISNKSLFYFYLFLKDLINIKLPDISISPEYNIYISWKSTDNRVFSVHFLPDSSANFVIFKPNRQHSGKVIRIYGKTTYDGLFNIAESNGVIEWITE